jgi:glyoxylase-like metal-dependent hydrolase (beta-lactamase superfamily II)
MSFSRNPKHRLSFLCDNARARQNLRPPSLCIATLVIVAPRIFPGADAPRAHRRWRTPGLRRTLVSLTPRFEKGLLRLSARVQRLVAPNASLMTGPGTNTYLLGDPPRAVIDPGPDDASHIANILHAAPALEAVFVTHTHPDHSPGARELAARSGARLIGRPPPDAARQDRSFVPQQVPARDERFGIGDATLLAIDTPGHASNHVCYLLEEEGLLFSGDHVLDGVTPVILAPDGDMTDYLDSLQRLKAYPLRAIAPGHGGILSEPFAVIDAVIAHRHAREAKVVAVLARLGTASIAELLEGVYADVNPLLHPIAQHTLEAHLVKLERERRCSRDGERWIAI